MRRSMTARLAVVAVVALVTGLLWPEPAEARREKMPPRQELINVLLSPDLSQWLAGPIYFIATQDERRQFLELEDDVAAERFIDEFWRRRDPAPELFGNEVRRLYEERVEEADRRFRERVRRGRTTDRGVIYTLYGEPDAIEFDTSLNPREPDLEVWIYSGEAPPGIDGESPRKRYYFADKDGETVLYTPRATRRSTIRQQNR